MKKIGIIVSLAILLGACSNNNTNIKKLSNDYNNNLTNISTSVENGILIGVSDPHIYSKKGPKLLSGTYYLNPIKFYKKPSKESFKKSYITNLDNKKVYYYDDVDGANAGIIVYILRKIKGKNNVSLFLLNNSLKKNLHNTKSVNYLSGEYIKLDEFTGGYIGTGKYLVAYNPNLINFSSGDLLLYSTDKGTMLNDDFYKKNNNKIQIKNLYWSSLINNGQVTNNLIKIIDKLRLDTYRKVYIYYPNGWYKSGIEALILEK